MAGELSQEARASVQIGDFGAWMASEQKRIFLLCRRVLQDAEEADSATQDVFFKAYKALNKQADPLLLDNPASWLTRIAVNTCLDRVRSKAWKIWSKRPSHEDEQTILELTPGTEPDAERQMFAKEIQQRLEAAMGKLSERQRAVFALRHYEAMSLEEIATALGLDLGTVKAHLFRAIGKLRIELEDLYLDRRPA